jgi:chemotaxis protein MotB
MADDDKKSTVIIVKKKGGHAGAHGGAWKVAYADFVTAMMAFFLLMWLLNSVSKEQKEALADYFQNFSIFDQPGRNKTRVESPPKSTGENKGKNKVKQEGVVDLSPDSIEGQKNQPFVSYGKLTPKEFVDKLQKTIETRLADIKNQIKIEITEDGVRIQLVDREGKDMFQPGSSKPTKDCDRALRLISESFRELPNPIALEGHTDSLGQNDGPNGNWQLSTRRALSARESLEEYGVDADQFVRVTGKADTEPLNPADTEDSQNRRVAITLLFDRPKRPGDAPELEPLNEEEGGAPPEEAPAGHAPGSAAPGSGEHGGGH